MQTHLFQPSPHLCTILCISPCISTHFHYAYLRAIHCVFTVNIIVYLTVYFIVLFYCDFIVFSPCYHRAVHREFHRAFHCSFYILQSDVWDACFSLSFFFVLSDFVSVLSSVFVSVFVPCFSFCSLLFFFLFECSVCVKPILCCQWLWQLVDMFMSTCIVYP